MSARIDSDTLASHFRRVAEERMQGLPIVNPSLEVEAVGFREFDEHRFGVLIAPWFMNMVLLPGNDAWSDRRQGDKTMLELPAEAYEFTVCRDEELPGPYLSAVLFRTVVDFPDQDTAREVAVDILERLFEPPGDTPSTDKPRADAPRYSRRALLSGEGIS